MVQFGWKAGTEQYPPDELLDYAVVAEDAGFDFVDASDHFHPWAEKGQASFAWSWLGAVAARTNRVMLGTGLTCPILRYHPAIVAQAAATMTHFGSGRFFLGVGTGEALNEYSATGAWPGYNERRAQMIEAIALIRQLWTGEPVTHRGEYFRTNKAKLYTAPKSAIPIFVSSMVPESAAVAGEHGDGLMTTGAEEEKLKELLKNFAEGAKKAGKNAARMPKMIELSVALTDDEDAAIQARKDFWAGTYVPALFTEKLYTPKMSEENGAVIGSDIIRDSACISADPKEHVDYLRKHLDLGFDHLVIHSAGPDQRSFIEDYGRLVLPELRGKSPKKKKAA